jgi:class 3 adenylate cyclase/hemerythrin
MGKREAPAGYEAYAAVALMCEEHRFLSGQFQALATEVEGDIELAAVTGRARKFMTFAAKHFLHEEWAMRISCFPELEVHELDHVRFISEADEMLGKLSSSPWRRRERLIIADVYWQWMDRHQAYDHSFTEYFREMLDARELMFDPGHEISFESPKAIGERRFAAVLCADVAGFARLVCENEAETIAAWCSCWHEIVKPAVIAHDGRIVKNTGDGFVAEFALPRDAVYCALVIQTAANQLGSTVTLGRRLMLRMGIHVCHVVPCGTDIFGHGVNIAARLQAEASPGTICISENVRRTIGSPEGFGCIDLGLRRLRNIDEPLRAYVIDPRDRPK